jgi:hypothetical protein
MVCVRKQMQAERFEAIPWLFGAWTKSTHHAACSPERKDEDVARACVLLEAAPSCGNVRDETE